MSVKFIDLFAGLGGIRLGFEQAFAELGLKTECVLTSEIKPYAVQSLQENFKHEKFVGDIRQVDSSEIPDFDFLLAGFPCQAFSTAGSRKGFLDTRGTLFFEIERILREKTPYGFILENVEGLVIHDRANKTDKIGRTFQTILSALKNLGYNVSWRVLDCSEFGVPQLRKRIFIVGTKDEMVSLEDFPVIKNKLGDFLEKDLPVVNSYFTKCLLKHYPLETLAGKAIKDKRGGKNNIHSWDICLKGEITEDQKNIMELLFRERRKKHWAEEIGIDWMDGMPLTLSQIRTFCNIPFLEILLEDLVNKGYLVKEHPKKLVEKIFPEGKKQLVREQDLTKEIGFNIVAGKLSFEFTQILDNEGIAPTLVATDISHIGIIDNQGIRRLTIREGLRLFGYPEEYNLSMFENKNGDLYKAFDLLGNTVVVPVVKAVSERVAMNFLKYKKDLI